MQKGMMAGVRRMGMGLCMSLGLAFAPVQVQATDAGQAGSAATAALPRSADAPGSCTATAHAKNGQVQLRWNAAQGANRGYHVDRRVHGASEWQALTAQATRSTSYQDRATRNGQAYEYRVRTVLRQVPPGGPAEELRCAEPAAVFVGYNNARLSGCRAEVGSDGRVTVRWTSSQPAQVRLGHRYARKGELYPEQPVALGESTAPATRDRYEHATPAPGTRNQYSLQTVQYFFNPLDGTHHSYPGDRCQTGVKTAAELQLDLDDDVVLADGTRQLLTAATGETEVRGVYTGVLGPVLLKAKARVRGQDAVVREFTLPDPAFSFRLPNLGARVDWEIKAKSTEAARNKTAFTLRFQALAPTTPPQPLVRGLTRDVYAQGVANLDELTQATPSATAGVTGFALAPSAPAQRFSGFLRIPNAGEYVVELHGQGAAQIWLGGLRVLSVASGADELAQQSRRLHLLPGDYSLELRHGAAGAARHLRVFLRGPGLGQQPLRADWLRRSPVPGEALADGDGDGYPDAYDAFPAAALAWQDLDGDGGADAGDADRDGDGVANAQDLYPDDGRLEPGEGLHPLVATPNAEGGAVHLAWAHQLAGEDGGYRVWRSGIDGLNPELLTAEPLSAAEFTDTGVAGDQAYQYFVTIAQARGDSRPLSAHPQPVFVAAAPAAPGACSLELVGDGVLLSWQGQADAYRLARRLNGADASELGQVAASPYRDTSVRSGGRYQYAVYALRRVTNPLTQLEEWRESTAPCASAELDVPSRLTLSLEGGTPIGEDGYRYLPAGPGTFAVQGRTSGALGPIHLEAQAGELRRELTVAGGPFSLELPVDFEHDQWRLSVRESEALVPLERVVNLRFLLDRDAPILSLAPDQEILTWAERVRVRGTVSDAGSGLASVRVRHSAQQTEVVATVDGEGRFEAELALVEGDNALEVLAVDRVGNEARLSLSVRRDSAPPELSLSAPDEGLTVYRDRIALAGEVVWRHAQSALTLSLNGQALALNPAGAGRYRFEQADVVLAEGLNTLKVSLLHPLGRTEQQRQVRYVPDETGPVITLTTANPSKTWLAELVVAGRIEDSLSGLARAWLLRAGDAQEIVLALGEDGGFSTPVALAEGDNAYTIWAEDRNGNRTQAGLSLVRDSARPELQVTAPSDGATVYAERVRLSGSVLWRHDAGVLQLRVNQNAVALSPGQSPELLTFQTEHELSEGDNVLAVVLDSPLGPVSRNLLVTRIRDEAAPTINLDAPADPETDQTQITLSGRVVDAGSGLERVWLTNDQYPEEFGLTPDGEGGFRLDVPLKLGLNTLTVRARDKAGNEAQQSVSLTRDDGRPSLTISAPAYGTRVEQALVTVVGTASWRGAPEVLALTVAGRTVNLVADGERSYRFEARDVPLSEGANDLMVRLAYPDGAREQLVRVIYQKPIDPPEDLVPALEIRSPLSGGVLSANDQTMQVQVVGSARPLAVRVGETVIEDLEWLDDSHARFSYPLHFEQGQSSLSLSLQVRDSKGREAATTASYTLDNEAPQIDLPGLLEFPAVNEVTATPYTLRGTVRDAQLAGLSLNGQPLDLAAQSEGVYGFSTSLALAAGPEQTLSLSARDLAGNRSSREFVLRLSGEVGMSILLPRPDSAFFVDGANLDLEVAARVTGVGGEQRVLALVDAGEWVSMAVTGNLAQGIVPVPPVTGKHRLTVEVRDATERVLQSQSLEFHLEDYAAIPLTVSRTQPENGAVAIEPNEFVAVHFNKPIDPSKLQVTVRETGHGLTYVNKDEPGTEFLNAQGAVLEPIDREQATVEGTLEILPGNRSVIFQPSQDLAYDGQVFVELRYEERELRRFSYRTRPLPTFLTGVVMDNLDQPASGLTVSLPELKREATTDGDGAFAFGFGDTAAEALPPGRHRLVINEGLKDRRFAVSEIWVSVEQGRRNESGIHRLAMLNQEVPFRHVASGDAEVRLAEGDLRLDLSRVGLRFPDGSSSGSVHSQFLETRDVDRFVQPGAVPNWVFAQQPAGIRVLGEASVRFNLPPLNGNYDYLPPVEFYVVLVGSDASGKSLQPVGVGLLKDHVVTNQGKLELNTLDYIGFAFVPKEQQDILQAYVRGELNLATLTATLQKQP